MANTYPDMAQVLLVLDRESVDAANASDKRRVLSQLACELRAAGQHRVNRGEVVYYDGVGPVEFGGQSSAQITKHVSGALTAAVDTMRLWGVEI